ncbi:MAG: PQQ-binding-like beta-propeller repeat protein [Planctomycetota bacterium]
MTFYEGDPVRYYPSAVLTLVIFSITYSQVSSQDSNWPQFRGPEATGVVADNANLPDSWSDDENVEWKVDIDGRGWSSPVVWGNKVFLTTVINSEESEEPKKGLYFGGNRLKPPASTHQYQVLCLDLTSGSTLWKKTVLDAAPQTTIHIKNSFASETPITDGKYLYALFGGMGIYCFDLDGNQVWSKELPARKTRYGWGTAASPVLHEDRLIILHDNDEESYLLALNKNTGEEIWRTARDEKSNWATPYIWKTKDRTEIITPGTGKVRSYDLDGNELWSLKGMSSITIATPYEAEGLLIISSGYIMDRSKPIYAIKPGATGDISLAKGETSNEFIAWCQPQGGPYNPSTIAYKGILYVLHDRGYMTAFDAKTGEEVYGRQRIASTSGFTTSPWAYNDKIFCLSEDGKAYVIQAGREFKLLSQNSFEADDMGMATPAIVGDRLLIRTAARIYSIKK